MSTDPAALPYLTRMHPCDRCGREWPSRLAAAECCDPTWDPDAA